MSSIKEVICICCPCGCHLQVDPENDYNVTGNACPNGAAYGREELTHPTRIITSTVRAAVPALPGKDCTGCAQREDDRGHGCAGPRHSARTRPHRAGGAGRCVRHRRGRCGDAKSVIHTPETIRR